ncbi:MAG: 16S rRNA (cytidine(1402)-2'-O)-methyltransferase [SAR202 cluster bacterium]|nr:16S rRNA (cytidine(1402)-2'-O)-methyltransferase [SAR202 cluster bacterium]
MHTLYIVGTPIGNLEDVTCRAVRVLREVGLIAAEDTRVTRRLLDRYGISTPLTSFHEHSAEAKASQIVDHLRSKDVALVSDAGMPGINDPGADLVAAAVRAGANVVPVPGPSAVTTAIAVSGLPVEQFVYVGFLPRKDSDRRALLLSLSSERRAIVAFETPHRMKGALQDILDTLGDRRIAAGRELTKLHEEVFRGTVSEAVAHFEEPRGEFTIVVEGAAVAADTAADALRQAQRLIEEKRAAGARSKDAVAEVSAITGVPKNDVYKLWVEGKPDA